MKILLHACCGPCALYPIRYFKEKGDDVDCYYYNPNIHPLDEHIRRGEALKTICDLNDVDVVYSCDFAEQEWKNFDGSMDERCTMCYTSRLEEVVRYARRYGYDAFTTSLLISPYQDHEQIKKICERLAEEAEMEFAYVDFRPNFREGQRLARETGVYMQKYCGCICSREGNGR